MPHSDNARLAAEAKSPTPRNQAVNTALVDLFVALTEIHFQAVLLRRKFAQASYSTPHSDNARLAVEAKSPTPRNQAVNTALVDLFVALTEMQIQVVLLRRKFAQKRSMPHSDNARLAPMAKSVTAREHNVFNYLPIIYKM